jgi:hypothetical protein
MTDKFTALAKFTSTRTYGEMPRPNGTSSEGAFEFACGGDTTELDKLVRWCLRGTLVRVTVEVVE